MISFFGWNKKTPAETTTAGAETYDRFFGKLDSLKPPLAPLPPQRPPTSLTQGAPPQPESKPAAAPEPEVIALDLKDFLDRIPPEYLLPGPHDEKARVAFPIAELLVRIEAGDPMISLSEIVRRHPGVIDPEAVAAAPREIYFPWHKIVQRVRKYRARHPKPEDKTPLFTRREFHSGPHDYPEDIRRSA